MLGTYPAVPAEGNEFTQCEIGAGGISGQQGHPDVLVQMVPEIAVRMNANIVPLDIAGLASNSGEAVGLADTRVSPKGAKPNPAGAPADWLD